MSQEPRAPATWRRALRVGLLSFLLAGLVNYASNAALAGLPGAVAFLVVLLLIAVNNGFDLIGTSVTAAEQSPLHAMAAKRIHGSRQALWLVRNADRVANFANDVVGDVTGAVTGAAGTTLALRLAGRWQGTSWVNDLVTLLVVGLIAGLTVGTKAAGKSFAIRRATDVVFFTGRLLYGFERVIGRSVTGGRSPNSSRRRTT